MLFRPVATLAVASTIISSASAQLGGLLGPGGLIDLGNVLAPGGGETIDLGNVLGGGGGQVVDLGNVLGAALPISLFTDGVLVNLGAFASVLTNQPACSATQTLGLQAQVLNLLRVCACVSLLNDPANPASGPNPNACVCPANAQPICANANSLGGGVCACECKAGFFSGTVNGVATCIPTDTCQPPNTLTANADQTSSTCTCSTADGYVSNGAGGCSCPAGSTIDATTKKCVTTTAPPNCPAPNTLAGTTCTCSTADGYVSDGAGGCTCPAGTSIDATTKKCVPTTVVNCQAPNTLSGTTCTCSTVNGYISDGAGGCACPAGFTIDATTKKCISATGPSQRARMARKMKRNTVVPRHPHAARAGHQDILSPPILDADAVVNVPAVVAAVVNADIGKPSCPDGETACALSSGGFECIDTESSLTSCGGCVGAGAPGINCLALPGALSVECHAGKCAVASCFKGWRFLGGKCV